MNRSPSGSPPEPSCNDFVADEFVVATAHRDLMLPYLDGTGATVHDEAPELGLSLVRLADPHGSAAAVRRRRLAEGAQLVHDDGELRVEQLMADLRALFARRYGNWIPTLGKNRVMRGVQFFPYPSAGGSGMPKPLPKGAGLLPSPADPKAGRRVRVGVLDTAVAAHPLLAGRFIADPGSMLAPGGTPLWWAGHGTFVAGLVVQRAPAVELEMESVLGKDDGTGPSVWQVARSLGRYARSGADIVNLSFGCFTLDGQPPLVLERAVNRLTASMVVVAAAGNYGEIEKAEPPNSHTPIWPAAFEEVVAVGANTAEGAPAGFTPQAPWIDLRAIGVDVDSSYLDGNVELDTETVAFTGAARWSGTSFAAASVAGAIAARTEPGRRTAHEALDELRAGAYGGSDSGIEVLAASKL